MIVKCAKRKAQEQATKLITTLTYEVTLLRQRNTILSQQNQQLSAKIQTLQQKYSQIQSELSNFNSISQGVQQYEAKFNRIVSGRLQKLKLSGNKNKQNQNQLNIYHPSLKTLQQLFNNKCNQTTIVQHLFEIVQMLMENHETTSKRDSNKISKIKKIQQALMQRKQNRRKPKIIEKQVLHVIKQPNFQHFDSKNILDLEFDCAYKLYEKLIIHVKKQGIDCQVIWKILEAIKSTFALKKQVYHLYQQAMTMQHEFSLGQTSSRILQGTTQLLIKAQNKYTEIKSDIETHIQSL